jgi:hypothetical protein
MNKKHLIIVIYYILLSTTLQAKIQIIETFTNTSGLIWGVVPYKAQSDLFTADKGTLNSEYTITENHGAAFIFGKDLVNGYLALLSENDTLRGNGLSFMAKGKDIVRIYISTDKHSNQNDISHHLYMQITLDTSWKQFYLPWNDFSYTHSSMERPPLTKDTKITSLTFWPDRLKAGTSGHVEIKDVGYFYHDNENNDTDKDGIPDSYDYDCDNDGYFNNIEALFGTDSLNALSNGLPEEMIKMPDGSYTGIFITGGWSDEYLDFIRRAEFKPAFIAVWANHWGNTTDFYYFDKPLCDWIVREKAIPFYIWSPKNTTPPPLPESLFDTTYSYHKILQGDYDTEITERIVEPVKDFKMPMILDILGEYNSTGIFNFGPNGRSMPAADSCSFLSGLCRACGTAAYCDTVSAEEMNNQYGLPQVPDGPERARDTYLHIVDLFKNAGTDNVMYTMHAAPYNDFGRWNRLSNYYPPEEKIDWHSTSAHFGVRQNGTQTLGQVIDATYNEMIEIYPQKSVFLVEFGIHSDSSGTKDMGLVMNTAFCQDIPSDYPMVRGWTYVNSDRYETDYKSTSLELDEARINEFDGFVQCLENNRDKYFDNIQTFTINTIQENNHSFESRGMDGSLFIYPNPAGRGNTICIKYASFNNHSTTKENSLAQGNLRAALSIYDLLGRRVYHQTVEQNQGSMIWNADDRPSGIYFIRLEAAGKIKQEKVVIIK